VSKQSKRKKHDLIFTLDEYKRTDQVMQDLNKEVVEGMRLQAQQVIDPQLPSQFEPTDKKP
jgi:protein-tyrosine-phosphatase